MKICNSMILSAALTALLLSCSDNVKVDPELEFVPAEILNVADPLSVDLDTETYLDLIWTSASWNGEGIITYTVLIDTEDGDFSEPLKVLNPAYQTQSIALSAAKLTEIFTACVETPESETATAIWAVKTSADGNTHVSDPQIINIRKSLAPPAPPVVEFEVGMSIFTAGEGALESGRAMSQIVTYPFDTSSDSYSDNQGLSVVPEYEIFTMIEQGKDFVLTYGQSADKTDGYITFNDAILNSVGTLAIGTEQPESGFKVEETGVYRVRLNTTEKKVVVQKVKSVILRSFGTELNAKGKWQQAYAVDTEMTYQGNGVWKIPEAEIKWGNSSYANRFDTYKFVVMLNEGDAQLYGALDKTVIADGSNPTKETSAKYWALQPSLGGAVLAKAAFRVPQWLISETKNPAYKADIILTLNMDGAEYYRHSFENEKEVTE